MNEYFVNINDSYVPSYKPGFPGYGQDGANANTGAIGASVYYSSIDFSTIFENTSLLEKVNYLIKNGKSLSNNDVLVQAENVNSINYKENDIIIDSTGAFYYLSDDLSLNKCDFNKDLKSEIAKNIKFLDVYCATKYYRSASLTNETNNNSIDQTVTSYKFIHNDNNTEKLYGNYVKFDLSFKETFDTSNLIYKFVLILPDGRVLEHYNTSSSDLIFVENKLLFNCVDALTGKDMASITMKDIKDALVKQNKWTELSVTTDDSDFETPLKDLVYYYGVSSNNLSSISVSIIMSYIIRNNCSAYVEISDKSNGEVYRLDVDDSTIKVSDDQNNLNDHIKEGSDNARWKPNITEYPIAKYLKNEDGTLFYPFISYVMFSNETPSTFDMAENNVFAQFYFTNAGGLSYYLAHNFNTPGDNNATPDNNIIEHYNLSAAVNTENSLTFLNPNNNKTYTLADRNRTYKLLLRGIKKVSISISFTSYNSFKDKLQHPIYDNTYVNYPNAIIYVGCPDIPLIDYDYIPDASLNMATGSINYFIKFIPPTYENGVKDDNTKIANAGTANVTIDLEEFGIKDNNTHYIEIGVSLIENVKALKIDETGAYLLPTLVDDNYFINNQNKSFVEYLNSLHRPSLFAGGVGEGNYYQFLSSELIMNTSETSFNTMQTINENGVVKRPSQLSGIPDIKMYISKLEEFDDYTNSDELVKITEPRHRDIPTYNKNE